MNFHRPRYSLIKEPESTWMVWDNWHGEPASLDNRPLIGLREERATLIMIVMTRIGESDRSADSQLRQSIDKLW